VRRKATGKKRHKETRHGEKTPLEKRCVVSFQCHFHGAFTTIQMKPNPIHALKCLLLSVLEKAIFCTFSGAIKGYISDSLSVG
jgi:hypothetical protein